MSGIEAKIIDSIAEESGIDRSEITLDTELYSIGIDSLSALELLAALEERYDVRISEADLANLTTVRKIIDVIDRAKKIG